MLVTISDRNGSTSRVPSLSSASITKRSSRDHDAGDACWVRTVSSSRTAPPMYRCTARVRDSFEKWACNMAANSADVVVLTCAPATPMAWTDAHSDANITDL